MPIIGSEKVFSLAKRVSFTHYIEFKVTSFFCLLGLLIYSAALYFDYAELRNQHKSHLGQVVTILSQPIQNRPLDSIRPSEDSLFRYAEKQFEAQGVKGLFIKHGSDLSLLFANLNEKTPSLYIWTYPLALEKTDGQLVLYVSKETVWDDLFGCLVKYLLLLLLQTLIVWGLIRYRVSKRFMFAVRSLQKEFDAVDLDDPKKMRGEGKLTYFVEYQLLLKAMNTIIQGLVSSRRELFALNNQLEEKVKEKTSNLEEKNNTLIKLNKRLSVLANTDALTQVYNRTRFDLLFREHVDIAERQVTSLSFLLIDLDDFKHVNDQLGHQAGDDVLRCTAKTLDQVVADKGVVARWGGEEFAVLLPNTDIHNAQQLAESLRHEVEQACYQDATKITISVGVAQRLKQESCAAFLQRADKAMYQAKKQGRNRVIVDPLSLSCQP